MFRSWGRVGTTIGGTKLEVKFGQEYLMLQVKTYDSLWNQEFESKHDAQRDFEFQYEDKTGNKWKNRDNFQKVVGVFNHHLLYSFQVGGPKVFPPGY